LKQDKQLKEKKILVRKDKVKRTKIINKNTSTKYGKEFTMI